MMMRIGPALAAAVMFSLSACSDGSDRAPDDIAPRVDTIAGLIRVTNPATAPEAWSFEPVLTLGTMGGGEADGPEVFGRIASIVSDDEGDVYIADSQALEVRVFDREGNYLRTIGRSGEGPGEFGALASLTWNADTLHVLDWRNARLQRFTGDGEAAGTIRWIPLSGSGIRFFPTPDNRIYTPGIPPRPSDGPPLPGAAFLIYESGALVDSLALIYRDEVTPLGVECVFAQGVSWYMSPAGPRRIVAPAGGGRILYAIASEYRIRVLDAAGDTVREIVRDGGSLRPMPDSIWAMTQDSVRALRARVPTDSSCSPDELERPANLPVLADLLYDFEGHLVVERETDTGHAFDFHDREDRLLASAAAPPRDRRVPPYFRDGHLYVATLGEFDIPGVAVYRIVRP